jgi:hypothetical protein
MTPYSLKKLKQYDFTAMHQSRCFTWQFTVVYLLMIVIVWGMGLLSYKQFQLLEYKPISRNLNQKQQLLKNTNIEISQTGLK